MNSNQNLLQNIAPILLLAVVAIVLVVSHTPVGAAISMDSLYYLSAASNVLEGNGIVYKTYALSGPNYQPLALWAPLYPIVLAGLKSLAGPAGVSDVAAIGMLNICALFVTMILTFRIASMVTTNTTALVVAIAVALSPSLQIVHTYAWSEVLFVPLTLAAYLKLQRYLADDGSPGDLVLTVVLLGIATYARYVGLAFFAAAALSLLLYGRGDLAARFRTATVAGVAYLALLAPMLLRNYAATGALSGGDRGTPEWSLLADLGTLGWYLHLEFMNLPIVLAAATALLSVGSFFWLLRRNRTSSVDASSMLPTRNMTIPFLFAVGYLAFLLFARGRQTINLDSRMLSVAIPFIAIGLATTYQFLARRHDPRLAALPFVFPLIAFGINAFNTSSSITNGWRELGEPGPVLGLTYHSVTGRQMDPLRSISEYFALAAGDIVLTDVQRPMIVDYFFPSADVLRMPGTPDEGGLAALAESLGRPGIAIVSSNEWSAALSKELEGRAEFFTIEAKSGGLAFIVLQLPVSVP